MTENTLTHELEKYAKKIGIDLIGFADPRHFTRYPKRNRPTHFLKEAKSVIIAAIYMHDISLDIWTRTEKNKEGFHFLDSILENKLFLLKDFLEERGYESKIIPYQPGIYLKEAAALAGIGSIGKNNLLTTERFGSQHRLRGMVSSAPLNTGEPIEEKIYCEGCKECIKVCPAKALSEKGYDRNKCLKYNFENMKKVSRFGEIWCNQCITSCPVGLEKRRLTE